MVNPSNPTTCPEDSLPTVLVIDDERGPRESLRILLKPDCRVLCADSVDAGIALLREHHPDTVVMDIRMPGKDGIKGLKAIRELDATVSVIMFTGFGALETAQEAIRLGANEYLKKPFDAFEIRGVINHHVARTRQERYRKEAEQSLKAMNQSLKEELERRTHLASLGQKSAELVHDLRNPLTVVMGYTELLADKLRNPQRSGDPEDTATYLKYIEKSVIRCRDIAEMWLDISRGKLRREPLDARTLVQSIVSDCKALAEQRHVRLEVEDKGGVLKMVADPVQMGRALQNLITNALEAVEMHKGIVRVWSVDRGNGVEIGVADNGCGMTEAQIQRASEPFYTTKKDSGGTGLGLFIARQVIDAHEGTFQIDSQPGQGTSIIVTVPHIG